MIINEINYSETVELVGLWKKIGVRASLDEGDDKDECFKQLQATVRAWRQTELKNWDKPVFHGEG